MRDRISCTAKPWQVSLVVGLAAVAAYANTLANGFVFDDVQNILQNPWVKDPRFLSEIFTHHAAGFDPGLATSYYRPAMHVFYLLSYLVFGLEPWGFHLVNVLLHAGTSILTLWVSSRAWRELCGADPWSEAAGQKGPLLVALIFALHPIHTEAVAWLAGITDLSFAFFSLLAFFLFIRAERPLDRWNLSAALAFLAAALCKEPAVVLPMVLLGYDALRRRTSRRLPWKNVLARLLPFAAVGALYMALRINALGGFAPSLVHRELDTGATFANGVVLFAQYWWKLVWPAGLSALHVFRPVSGALEPPALLAMATVAGLMAFTLWAHRRPILLMGLLLVVVPLLPALYIPALGERVFAERYLYLPVFGFGLLLAPALIALARRSGQAAIAWTIAPVLLLAGYGAATTSRNRVWRDSLTLWTATVAESPDSAAAHEYLGFALYTAGRLDEAIASYSRAIALDPNRPDSHSNLGVAFALLGRHDEAIAEYETALRLGPNSAETRTSLGLALVDRGHLDRGIDELRAALALNPALPAAHNNLGVALIRSGRLEEAVARFAEAAALDPVDPTFRQNLDRARAQIGSSYRTR